MNKLLASLLIIFISSCTLSESKNKITTKSEYVKDNSRNNRQIPIEIYFANQPNKGLVIINAGYGCSATEYSYIAKYLSQKDYLVVSIQHELQTDEILPSGENVYELRLPNWREGVKNIEAVLSFVKTEYPYADYQKISLIGHSNGGDISMLFATEFPDNVKSVISLDHRRMPIPRSNKFKILSIRADEFQADKGVIPNISDLKKYNIEIVGLNNVEHNYLRDNATEKTKAEILDRIEKLYD